MLEGKFPLPLSPAESGIESDIHGAAFISLRLSASGVELRSLLLKDNTVNRRVHGGQLMNRGGQERVRLSGEDCHRVDKHQA